MVEKAKNPITTLSYAGFGTSEKNEVHRTPRVPPLYIAIPTREIGCSLDGQPSANRGGPIEILDDLWVAVGCRLG